jgi:hypothetical protein
MNGSSRFGKTEALKAFSHARPGLFRVVQTPEDQAIHSLCRAIAKALGIACDGKTCLQLREQIELVLETSHLMVIFDESQFLYPVRFSKNSRPHRLDFVRRVIIDPEYSAAFVSTPQSYHQARRKFERATGFTFEQLDGRLLTQQPAELPEEISHEEVIAVAAVHLQGLDSAYHEVVARYAEAVKGSVFS